MILGTCGRKKHIPFSGSHLTRLLSVLLGKHNCYFSAKNNLSIHIVFCISSIGRIEVLDKPKSSRLPVTGPKQVEGIISFLQKG
jgi:hypothetical protein